MDRNNIIRFNTGKPVILPIADGTRVVFTNGCFDILHAGHVQYLEEARSLGDFLVVGLNSDASVKMLDKGPSRPINDEQARALVLSGLKSVDQVVIFDQETPEQLIKAINPNILVKGGDWKSEDIVGSDHVMASGGEIRSLKFLEGYSTSNIEAKILQADKNNS